MAAVVAVPFASTALAEKRVALIVANGAHKGAPLTSLTNIGFVVKVMKNVDLDEFDRGVTEFAREANGVDVALFEPMPRETIANSALPDPFRR